MSEYDISKLLELDLEGARKLVQEYKGPDKREVAEKVSCVVQCHIPVDKKIKEYLGYMDLDPEIKKSLGKKSEKIAHLYLVSHNGNFPPSRDHVALACFYIASQIDPNLPELTMAGLADLRTKSKNKAELEKFLPEFDVTDSDVSKKWSRTLSNYTKGIVGDILAKFTNLQNIDSLLENNLGYESMKGLIFNLVGEVYNKYAEFVKPCEKSEIEKVDASDYEKRFGPSIESMKKRSYVKKNIPENVRGKILKDNSLRKRYEEVLVKFNFFEEPVNNQEIPKYQLKYIKKFEGLGLIEYDNDKHNYKAKDLDTLKNIKIIATNQ